MKTTFKYIIGAFIVTDLVLFFKILLTQGNIQIFNPQGFIALQQENLVILYVSLMLIIVIPVLIFTAYTARKYRAGNTKAPFTPDAKHSMFSEVIVWALPTTIVLVMSVITWVQTHKLDPTKSIVSNVKPLTIEVVSLQWKWLFIYPKQHIATVNFLEVPTNTPLVFKLTADSPMNSFWIPQLGGQMYSMVGMVNSLNLIADKPGDYRGSTAEISGKGFAGMKFVTRAATQDTFNSWVQEAQRSSHKMNWNEYKKLAVPSEDYPPTTYTLTDETLYNKVVMQFMPPMK